MGEQPISAAVRCAWQIAAEEALRAGAPEIEPEHLMIGILGLEKVLAQPQQSRVAADELASLRKELELLAKGLAPAQKWAEVRRKLRTALPSGTVRNTAGKISRSHRARQLFVNDSQTDLPLVLVTFAIRVAQALDSAWRKVCEDSGLDLSAALALLSQAEHAGSSYLMAADAPHRQGSETEVQVATEVEALDASVPALKVSDKGVEVGSRLACFIESLWKQAPGRNLDEYLQTVVERLVAAIPSAGRGAILIPDNHGRLLLRAHVPSGTPSVSFTSAHRAMSERRGVIWQIGDDLTRSQQESSAQAGMYAPLLWNESTFGVLCVDNLGKGTRFSHDDLTFLVAAAHHLGLIVANQELTAELQRNTQVLQRLLTSFSPKLRTTLLDKARRGRLRLGGECSEVTILFCDMRGFTRVSSTMSSEDIMEMLNEYFQVLTDTIFKYQGTLDKYIGDAVLAVFGSPEPDPHQQIHAVHAALEMQERAREVNLSRTSRGLAGCEIGIALHCGEVLHGFVGSSERMEFTVIGEAVNRASRFCGGAAAGDVVISPELYKRVWNEVEAIQVAIPFKHEGDMPGYRVVNLREKSRKLQT